MTDYPFAYPFQGQPPQQQYPPYPPYGAGAYAPQPATGYGSQPSHQPQQPQSHPHTTTNHYVASQSAHNYNASSIPGLGTPSNAPPPFAPPLNGSWSQSSYGASAARLPLAQLSTDTHSDPFMSRSSYTTFQAPAPVLQPSQPGSQLGPGPAGQMEQEKQDLPRSHSAEQRKEQCQEQPKPPPLAETESQDEGEISDSYFDDLYDDVPGQSAVGKEPAVPSTNALVDAATEASDQDQEPNFYDTDMDEAAAAKHPSVATSGGKTHNTVRVHEETDRARSRSYSPRLSLAEIRQDSPPRNQDPNDAMLNRGMPTFDIWVANVSG